MTVSLKKVALPAFGRADRCPEIPLAVYGQRRQAVVARMVASGLDLLAIYGDREHTANLSYLTGFDPRFEEALLLLDTAGHAKLLVGNECLGYLPDAALGIEVELFQGFSLMGQPRDRSRTLRAILADFGAGAGSRIGAVGWKSGDDALLGTSLPALDVPAYLADLLRELTGATGRVVNATGIFMDVEDGLRLINEPEQIAAFEYAASVASDGLLALLRHLAPGVREDELEHHFDSRGLPLSCHRMVSFGDKVRRGLASASANAAKLGDAYTTAFGVNGALSCRAGVVARNADDLAPELRNVYPRVAANYFGVVRAWYAALGIGVPAGEVFAAVEAVRDDALYDFAVNPGHYLHLDEWVNSPFYANSPVRLRSGMALQMDIIPVVKGPFCYVNAEDGIVLADASLRAELASRFPAMWQRILARRAFMGDALGFTLDDAVLPLGNTPGWFPPYALDLEHALVVRDAS